jgi:ribosomal protein L29
MLNSETFKSEIIELKKEVFNLRFQRLQDSQVNLARFKKVRRKIAQNLTYLSSENTKLSKVK